MIGGGSSARIRVSVMEILMWANEILSITSLLSTGHSRVDRALCDWGRFPCPNCMVDPGNPDAGQRDTLDWQPSRDHR
jgi:hypothetical protein